MKLIDKDALVAELKKRIRDYWSDSENTMGIYPYDLEEVIKITDTLEVKDVNEVPATVMVNKYGNRFISSWSGLKEYDGLKEGQEIKILIPKK